MALRANRFTGKNFFFALFMLSATLNFVLAPSAIADINLIEILQLAEKEDPKYHQVQNEAKSVAALVPHARSALFLPHLRLSASKKKIGQDIQLNSAFGTGGKTNFVSTQYRMNLTQPVYHHDRIVSLSQAKKKFKRAQITVLFAHQDLIYRVALKYFDVLAAEDELLFAKSEKLSLKGQLERAKQRFEVGLIAITDVQEAEAGFDRALANQISASNRLQNSVENLREITGFHHRKLSGLGTDLPFVMPNPADIDAWTEKAISGNLKLAEARLSSEIQKDEITKTKSKYLPTLDIVGGHAFNKQGGRFGSSEIDATDIGIEVSVPLFLGGDIFFKAKKEKFDYIASLDMLEQTQRSVEREARETYLGVVTQISLVTALARAVTSAKSALESTKAGFEVGNRTTIDIVDAESVLSQAKQDHAKAKYDYILNTLNLKKVTGMLDLEDVGYVNGWLSDSKFHSEL